LSSVPQKRRELGSNGMRARGSERSTALLVIVTLKAEPQERQEHETGLRTDLRRLNLERLRKPEEAT
jgi:hypothetical protein